MRGTFLAAGLINIAALSALFISNLGWKCERGYFEAAHKHMTDAPMEVRSGRTTNDNDNDNDSDDDEYGRIIRDESRKAAPATKTFATSTTPTTDDYDYEPSYLQWDASPAQIPANWSFQTPRSCANLTDFHRTDSRYDAQQKIIVHYHMQHNAGTSFYSFAKRFAACATRSCWQDAKHCMVSSDEEVEAENLRRNYRDHGVQYVSYELMLPPRFPLPFVSDSAREGLFFTTIVRDPFKRFLTYVRRHQFPDRGLGPDSPFWKETQGVQGPYAGDNLNARWLSGALEGISGDHVNIAKCRLQLFDLVIADKLMDHAIKEVMCPLNGWKGMDFCEGEVAKVEHKSKPDPLNGTDPLLVGAWIERLRPSFEIYDYARILSWKQLKQRGVQGLPELSEVPSYMDTLAKYANIGITKTHFKRKMKSISLENEEDFSPPVEFCDMMKRVWTNNPDEVPNAFGIGTIKNGFHPFLKPNAPKNE